MYMCAFSTMHVQLHCLLNSLMNPDLREFKNYVGDEMESLLYKYDTCNSAVLLYKMHTF